MKGTKYIEKSSLDLMNISVKPQKNVLVSFCTDYMILILKSLIFCLNKTLENEPSMQYILVKFS